jgi:pseudouridine-5'-phosphate glycosidase
MKSAVLVCQSLPLEEELPREKADSAFLQARQEAQNQGVHGQQLTPFLLSRIDKLTNGASVKANLMLLLNNARLAAHVAVELSLAGRQKTI